MEYFTTMLALPTLLLVLKIIVELLVGSLVIKFAQKLIDKSPIDATIKRFLNPTVKVVVYFIVIMMIAQNFGFNVNSIVALAGVFSAAVALACQNLLGNLFGGLIMLATKPFVVGDYVSAAGFEGTVEEIGLFVTTLLTVDNKTVKMPNGMLSGTTLVNYTTAGSRRVDIQVTASYDSKVPTVKASLEKAVNNTANVDLEKGDTFIRLSKYGESSIEYTVRVWCDAKDYWQVYFDLLENVKIAFDEDGVEMTYPHINVHGVK